MNAFTALPSPADARHLALLDAAVGVFARYGFRKSSMEDVARAAGVSRQGLYLVFSNKEELFRRTLIHSLEAQMSVALTALSSGEEELAPRLIEACVAWSGRFVESLGADATDLACAGAALAGAMIMRYEAQFEAALAVAIATSPLAGPCESAGLEPQDVARVLHATARGLKQSCKTRDAFLHGITAAVRLMCMPMNQRQRKG